MDETTEAPQHPGWTLNFDLTREELIRFSKTVRHAMHPGLIYIILFGVCLVFSSYTLDKLGLYTGTSDRGVEYCVLMTGVLFWLSSKFYADIYYRNWWLDGDPVLAKRRMDITQGGVFIAQHDSNADMNWSAIDRIIPDEKAVYLMTGHVTGYVVPYRVLPPDVIPSEFLRVLRSFKECTRS